MNIGRLWHPQQRVLIKIGFLYLTLSNRNSLIGQRTQAVDDRTLDLILNPAEIDDLTHIGGDPNVMYREFAIFIDTDFGHLSNMPRVAKVKRQTQPTPRWHLSAPARLLANRANHLLGARSVERIAIPFLKPLVPS